MSIESRDENDGTNRHLGGNSVPKTSPRYCLAGLSSFPVLGTKRATASLAQDTVCCRPREMQSKKEREKRDRAVEIIWMDKVLLCDNPRWDDFDFTAGLDTASAKRGRHLESQ